MNALMHALDTGRGTAASQAGDGLALRTIVVATDFSSQSTHVIDRAAALVEKVPVSRVILAHVVPESPIASIGRHFMSPFPGNDSRHPGPEYRLAAVAEDFRERTGVVVDTRLESGHCVRTLQQLAPEADLMILGATDCHSIRGAVVGSTAERVLGKARQPLLVVRRRGDAPYRRVLIAVDLETGARNALRYARKVAFETNLDLIHVPAHGDVVSRILEKARELSTDLIVVTKRAESRLRDLLLESVALQLLTNAECDVLVVRPDEDFTASDAALA